MNAIKPTMTPEEEARWSELASAGELELFIRSEVHGARKQEQRPRCPSCGAFVAEGVSHEEPA